MRTHFSTKQIILGVLLTVATLLSMLVFFLLATGVVAVVAAEMPRPPTQPCGGAVIWGNGGSQCDGPVAPDGSFQRCVSVYVLGFGGWNCFTVYP